MTTTIKVSDETKHLLDMLQARMTLALRRKKNLTELIDDITRLALRHEDELLHDTDKRSMGTKEKNPDRRRQIGRKSRDVAGKTGEYIYVED